MYTRKKCLLVTNCTGDGITYLLNMSDDFHQRYETRLVICDYYAQVSDHLQPITDIVKGCDVLVYHHPDWMFTFTTEARDAFERHLAELRPEVVKISLPYAINQAFWPFAVPDPRNLEMNRPPSRHCHSSLPHLPHYQVGDGYILDLLEQGLPPEEVITRYLALDVSTVVDLEKMMSYTITSSERNERSGTVKVADFLANQMRVAKLFNCHNHPSNRLLLHMANQILSQLDCRPVPETILYRLQELIELEQPIHPSIGEYFGLSYANAETRYAVDRVRRLTFAEWVREYVYLA